MVVETAEYEGLKKGSELWWLIERDATCLVDVENQHSTKQSRGLAEFETTSNESSESQSR